MHKEYNRRIRLTCLHPRCHPIQITWWFIWEGTISKFSAPIIAFLAFWLAKKLRLWANMSEFYVMENSAPSLKIFRTKFSTSALYNGRNKTRRQNPVWEFTKTIIPFALVGYEVIITRYALVGYFITSCPTRAHGIIVIYSTYLTSCRQLDVPR